MSRRNKDSRSLQSVANSLSAKHYRQQKPNRNVTVKENNPADKLRPGRHRCDCQARIHGLIRNCIGCGRVVCEQEGSGPCLFCGELVCTREQRAILESKSKKSLELYSQLMGTSDDKSKDGISLASLGVSLSKAVEYKNKLLEADADTEKRTRVNDLESDYYNMENNAYLTKEEREAIIARKEELKQIRAQQKRALVLDFDLANASVNEAKGAAADSIDPVIQAVLDRAMRRRVESSAPVRADWVPASFVPKYDTRIGHRSRNIDDEGAECEEDFFYMQQDEIMHAEVERKGYAIPVPQPLASLLARGIRRHIPWHDDVYLRGPILIVSTGRCALQLEIDEEIARCRKRATDNNCLEREYPLEYPPGSFVGRALISNCLSVAEYAEQYPNGECNEVTDGYVLIFSVFEPLLVPIPHLTSCSDIYRVDKQLRTAIKHILDPYSFS